MVWKLIPQILGGALIGLVAVLDYHWHDKRTRRFRRARACLYVLCFLCVVAGILATADEHREGVELRRLVQQVVQNTDELQRVQRRFDERVNQKLLAEPSGKVAVDPAATSELKQAVTNVIKPLIALESRHSGRDLDAGAAYVVREARRAVAAAGAQLEWVATVGGTSPNSAAEIASIAADTQGNVVTCGAFSGLAEFGGTVLTSSGASDVFVAKYTPEGKVLWAREFQAMNGRATSCRVSPKDEVYLLGEFAGEINTGFGKFQSNGRAGFLSKLSLSSTPIWTTQFGGSEVRTSGVDVGHNSAFVTGSFSGTLTIGDQSATSTGDFDVFVAKIANDGRCEWLRSFGGPLQDYGMSVTLLSEESIAIGGCFSSKALFGSIGVSSAGGTDGFLAVLNSSNGSVQRVLRFGGSLDDCVYSLAASSASSIFLAGVGRSNIEFGTQILEGSPAGSVVVAKYSQGYLEWAKAFPGTGFGGDMATSVSSDNQGNLLFTGRISGATDFGVGAMYGQMTPNAFVAKSDSHGYCRWSKRFTGRISHGTAVCCDQDGNVLCAGTFAGEADFGNGPMLSRGTRAFLAKYKP